MMFLLGLTSANKWPYLLWSGIIGDFSLFGAIILNTLVTARRHNCEVHRCWRMGRHTGPRGHLVCRRHHPEGAPGAEDVR